MAKGKIAQRLAEEIGQILDMSQEARMARAKEMGFDTEKRLYHGSEKNFDQFQTSKIGSGSGAQTEGWGMYFSDSKNNASRFGVRQYEIITPEYFEKRYLHYNKKFSEQPEYIQKTLPEYRFLPDGHPRAGEERTGQEIYNQITKESRGSERATSQYLGRLGIVGAKFRAGKDMHARDKDATNYVIWDQDALNDLRRFDADFDPEKIHKPSLLAGALPIGAISAASMLSPNESYAQAAREPVGALNLPKNSSVGSIQAPQNETALRLANIAENYNKSRKEKVHPIIDMILPVGELPEDLWRKRAYGDDAKTSDYLRAAMGML